MFNCQSVDDVSIAVDFDDVLKLGIGDDGHGVGERCSKLLFNADGTLLRQVEMSFFGEIRLMSNAYRA